MSLLGLDMEKLPPWAMKAVVVPILAAAVVFLAGKVPILETKVETLETEVGAMRKEQLELMKELYLAMGNINAYNRVDHKLDVIQATEAAKAEEKKK